MERATNFLPRLDADPYRAEPVDRNVVALTAPSSAAAEQIRTLYFRLDQLRQARPLKILGISSALQGEGKTTAAVNLALCAARADADKRILLVDADLRRGRVGELLGIRSSPGLSEVLQGDADPTQAVRRFMGERLAVLPAGSACPEPALLLFSARMRALVEKMRGHFDEVYVDLPPALLYADAHIVGSLCDGVALVVRAGRTAAAEVRRAIDTLSGTQIVGCVLNGAEPRARTKD